MIKTDKYFLMSHREKARSEFIEFGLSGSFNAGELIRTDCVRIVISHFRTARNSKVRLLRSRV